MSQQINLISPLLLKKRYAFGLREMALGLGVILAAALAWGGIIYYQAGVTQISPSATVVKYTHQGFDTAFRVMANDAQQAARHLARIQDRVPLTLDHPHLLNDKLT